MVVKQSRSFLLAWIFLLFLSGGIFVSSVGAYDGTPTPRPFLSLDMHTTTKSPSVTPSRSPIRSVTPSPSQTNTATQTPSPSTTSTVTQTPTPTPIAAYKTPFGPLGYVSFFTGLAFLAITYAVRSVGVDYIDIGTFPQVISDLHREYCFRFTFPSMRLLAKKRICFCIRHGSKKIPGTVIDNNQLYERHIFLNDPPKSARVSLVMGDTTVGETWIDFGNRPTSSSLSFAPPSPGNYHWKLTFQFLEPFLSREGNIAYQNMRRLVFDSNIQVSIFSRFGNSAFSAASLSISLIALFVAVWTLVLSLK